MRACLAKAPADRPTPAEVVARTREVAEDTEPWLPSALIAELGRKAAELLDSDGPGHRVPAPPAGPPPGATPPPAGATPPLPASPPTPPPSVPPAPLRSAAPAPLPAAAPTPPPPTARPLTAPEATPAVNPPAAAAGAPAAPAPLGVFGAPLLAADPGPHGTGPQPPGPRRRRTALLAGAAVAVIALLAGGITYATVTAGSDGTDDKRTGAQTSPSAGKGVEPAAGTSTDGTPSPDPSPDPAVSAAVEGIIGKEYLGTWEGTGKNDEQQPVSFRRITLTQGGVGADVATTFNSFDDALCNGAAELVSFDNLMVLESRALSSIPENACSDGGRQTVRAAGDGTLIWTDDDGESAVLTRSAENTAPIPAEFLGTWEYLGTGGTPSPDRATLVLRQGAYGEAVADYTTDGPAYHCEKRSILVYANSKELRLGPQEVTAAEPEDKCEAGGTRTVQMKGADGLSLSGVGSEEDKAPATFRRAD
ncbi:hypothetical protein [Streptomyces sp. NPDC020780]|uniref:hypothetical protein n=1 Tax=unclassified Streptomyces TaxID=2593676 RepID=UPI0037BE1CAD